MAESKIISRIINYLIKAAHQELVHKYLRSLRFEFFTFEQLKQKMPTLKDCDSPYSFMIRKGPKESLDFRLIVGIKIIGKKVDSIIIYKDSNFYLKVIKPWKKSNQAVNFKKIKITMKFPDEMDYEQRKIWRREHLRVKKNPEYKGNKLYNKFKDKIIYL